MHDEHATAGPGHNAQRPLQWQTPHLPHGHAHREVEHHHEPDLDLVEAAFVEGFARAPDPVSFLRLAGVPFKSERDGEPLDLVRVEIESVVDVASVTPLLGGGGHRVAPLPASHVSQRRQLGFHYLAGGRMVRLDLAEARALPNLTPPR
jgi:hypothetical protein